MNIIVIIHIYLLKYFEFQLLKSYIKIWEPKKLHLDTLKKKNDVFSGQF